MSGEDGTFLFNDDDLMAEFEGLVERAVEIHRQEVVQATERLARLSSALSLLGPAQG